MPELTLEQQFTLRSFSSQVEKMSHDQARDFLIDLYKQMMIRETMYKGFLKHEWGIGGESFIPEPKNDV
jgi:hypothetical protein